MKIETILLTKEKVNGIVVTQREVLEVQSNITIEETNDKDYDSINFQYITETKEPKIFDIILIYLKNNDGTIFKEYSFLVTGVVGENLDNKQIKYKYTITGTECTKRLEYYFLTRDFSQPTPNDLETLKYEGYTNRLKMVEEAKEFSYFVKDSDKNFIKINPFNVIETNTYNELSEEYSTKEIPAITSTNDTLKDVLDLIFSGLGGAVARLDYNEVQKFVLKLDKENEINDVVELPLAHKKRIIKNINGYGTFANPTLQNVLGNENLAVNGNGGRTFVAETTFFDTSTAKAQVLYPIQDVISFKISRFDNAIIKGVETEVDIAKHIIYTSQKSFLETIPNSSSELLTGLYKSNTISFNQGDTEIVGFGSEFESLPIPFIDNAVSVWENLLKVYGIATTTFNKNIQNWKFKIEYIPITNEKVEIFKNNFTEQNQLAGIQLQPIGQTLDFKRASNSIQDFIDKTGNDLVEYYSLIQKNENIEKNVNWFELKTIDKKTNKRIIKKIINIIGGNLNTIYLLANQEGYNNALNVVDSLKRESAIEKGINRDIIVNEFCTINFDKINVSTKSSITNAGLRKFTETFDTTNSVNGYIDNAVLIVKDLNFKLISLSLLKHLGKDVAKLGFRANDPVHLGYKRLNEKNKMAVRYAQLNGVLNNIGLSYGVTENKFSDIDFNMALPEINKNLLPPSEQNDAIVGEQLINLGNIDALSESFEFGETIIETFIREVENEQAFEPAVLEETTTFQYINWQYGDRFTVNIDFINWRPTYANANIDIKLFFDNVLVYEYQSIDKIENLNLDINLEKAFAFKRVDIEYNISYDDGGTINPTNKFNIETKLYLIEQIIVENPEQTSTDLTIKKNPNEIIGLFHNLNVIKHDRIITGTAFITENGLYTNERFENFELYGSTVDYYYENDINPKGSLINQYLTIIPIINENVINLNLPNLTSYGLKSYAVFGVKNDKKYLLFAINANYDTIILSGDSNIYLTFSSETDGLIFD